MSTTACHVVGEAPLPEQTRRYLSHPGLAPLWTAVRERLERSGLAASGTVTVTLDETGADRLSGLLGTPVTPGRARVRLAVLDAALRGSAAALGVATVTEQMTGASLIDRVAARAVAASSWSAVWARLDVALATAGVGDAAWVPLFVDAVRRSGLLTRAGVAAAQAAVEHAAAVIADLAGDGVLTGDAATTPATGAGEARWELAALASSHTGDAHGLDDGRLVAALVLRAGAAALRLPVPESAAARRDLWGRLGVTPDLVSGTVLAWGLCPPGPDAWSGMLRTRTTLGLVTHLTLQEMRGAGAGVALTTPRAVVSVCENAQVLQAAARASVPGPLLCVAGNPASVGWLVLRRLVEGGAVVRYHGDFDWPGIAIAGRVLGVGAQPWRMDSTDYLEAVAALPADRRLSLLGASVATRWDPALATAMRTHAIAVHEEALLAVLLADLSGES